MKYFVITNNRVIGFHRWKDAPQEVAFLRDRHRHVFFIKCWARVQHTDREIEIFTLEKEIERYLESEYGTPCEFGERSCEQIAERILTKFNLEKVEVLEDGFGGAVVSR